MCLPPDGDGASHRHAAGFGLSLRHRIQQALLAMLRGVGGYAGAPKLHQARVKALFMAEEALAQAWSSGRARRAALKGSGWTGPS